jgi:hypothetical protein
MHQAGNIGVELLDMLYGVGLEKATDTPPYVLSKAQLHIVTQRFSTVRLPMGVDDGVLYLLNEKKRAGKTIDKLRLMTLHLLPFALVYNCPTR